MNIDACFWDREISKISLRPQLYGPGYPRQPSPKATLSSVYMWKRSLCRSSQICPCMIIHNLYWIIKCTGIPLSLSFPRSFDHSGFCRVNCDLWYEFLLQILNLGITWHSLRLELSRFWFACDVVINNLSFWGFGCTDQIKDPIGTWRLTMF